MKYKTLPITHTLAMLLAVFVSFLFCFANTLQAAAMPGFERLQPVTANIKAPTAVALDIYGNIYVTESSTNRLLIYSQGGEHVETLSGLDKPISIAVDDDGRIFIGNSNKGNVEVYNAGLTLLFKLGTGDGEFTQPNAIAVDSAGDIYVADSKEDEINVYNPDGSYNFSFGGSGNTDGLFNFPTSIAIDEISGEIIISDLQVIETIEGARIQVFDMNGGFKRGFDAFGVGEGLLAKPLGVEVDEDGRIYVSDAYQNVVQVFDSDGTYLGTIYDLDNPLRTPLGMAFSKELNKLFIASLNSVRVEIYGMLDANITVTPAFHDFGGVNVGDTSIAQTFTISNIGNGNLVTGTITTAGTDASEFSIQNDICSGQTIAPSGSCTVEAVFSPTSAGTKSTNLSIPSNDPDTPTLDVPLSGIGNTVPAADPNGPYTGIEGQAITLDGSGSSDSDGSIVLYEWDIDDNGKYDYSSSLPTQSHIYAQQGTYTIKLRVTDNLGATDAATVTATISDTSPTANFTGSPTNGTAPLTVNFTNNSTGYDQPLSYGWDFDNNGTTDSADTNPSYTYSDIGTYTVKLTVTDSDGSADTLTRTDYITVALFTHTLTVEKAGTGTGTVTSSPAGIDCGTDCAEAYGEGTVVTLTATPDIGSTFSSWTGCNSSSGTACYLTMNEDKPVTAMFTNGKSAILLVDDDDNNPDVRPFYTDTLDTLGLSYDVWNTNNSDKEPDSATLALYSTVIWFSGAELGGFAGPGADGEANLGNFMDNGGCLFISSQDYLSDRGSTLFMDTYMGIASGISDVGQTAVTGTGSVFSGLGPYSLSYPFSNFSDHISPNTSAELAFTGDAGEAAIIKDGGAYRTVFFGFPFEALPNPADQEQVMATILNYCNLIPSIPLTSGWNLISLPLLPDDTSITSVLISISRLYTVVWSYENGTWKVYAPANPEFSDLNTMESGKGYWIYMNETGVLDIEGQEASKTLNLAAGWNLVGYNSSTAQPVVDALSSIAGKYVSVWAYIDGNWKVYDPVNPGSSVLTTMEPGYGYWINTTETCTWTLP